MTGFYEKSFGLPHEWYLADVDLDDDECDIALFECDHCGLQYTLELLELFSPPSGDCPARNIP